MDITSIIQAFKIKGDFITHEIINSGYINTTYKIITSKDCYILQKINNHIFKDIDKLSENIFRITTHIQSRTPKDKSDRILTIILTKKDKRYYKNKDGSFWRMFNYINNSKTIETLNNEKQAESLGKAFGNYHQVLSDLPQPKLFEVLPNFHNTPNRIEQLKKAIQQNQNNKLSKVKDEIEYLLSLAPEMHEIILLGNQEKIPLRTIHQDAKVANILFNQNNEIICIIDLDTTMSGYLAYDFGDAVRTGMNTASEGEKNIAKVSLDINLFKAFTKGYAKASRNFITHEEIKSLMLGVKIITYEQAIRFLADYLNNDIYYKTEYQEHNLVRTKVQISLLKDILKNFNQMNDFVIASYQ